MSALIPGTGPKTLACTGVAATHTGSTAEHTFATVNIPAGAMGLTGALRMRGVITMTDNANVKTYRVRLGGTVLFECGTADIDVLPLNLMTFNRGAANSQVSDDTVWISGESTVRATAVDTSAAQSLTITGQLADAGDTMSLQSLLVELLP